MALKTSGTIGLGHLSFTARVTCPADSDIVWLQEYLCPAFDVLSPGPTVFDISLILDGQLHRRLSVRLRDGRRAGVPGFILDTKTVDLLECGALSDSSLLYDDEFKVFYSVSPDRTRVTVLAHPERSVGYRTALARVITEFAMNRARWMHGRFLHAAALGYKDRALLIAGSKGAGKTTLLTAALQERKTSFITNDRALVRIDNGSTIVSGMPTVITLTQSSLTFFPRLREEMLRCHYHHRSTVEEIFANGCRVYIPEEGKYTLSRAQYCRLLAVAPLKEAPIGAVLFPRIDRSASKPELIELSGERLRARLERSRFARAIQPQRSFFDQDYRNPLPDDDYLSLEELAGDLEDRGGCFDCLIPLHENNPRAGRELLRALDWD